MQLTWGTGATPPEEPVLVRQEESSDRRPPEARDGGRRDGLLPGLSFGSSSEAGDAPQVGGAAAAASGSARGGQPGGSEFGLSLTRFLSNVVVACSQVRLASHATAGGLMLRSWMCVLRCFLWCGPAVLYLGRL